MTALRTTLFLVLFSLPAGAATLHVSKSGNGTTGANWSEAYRTIGDAMVSSASGDHLWVAAGTYNENIVLVTGVQLYGGFSGDETLGEFDLRNIQTNEAIIDATSTGENAVVIYGDCILDGFTVTGGGGSEEHLSLATGGVKGMGSNSTSVIRHCLIHQNRNFGINSFDGTIDRNDVLNNLNAVGIANGNGLIEDNEIGHNAPNGGIYNCLGTIRRNVIRNPSPI